MAVLDALNQQTVKINFVDHYCTVSKQNSLVEKTDNRSFYRPKTYEKTNTNDAT